MSCSNCNDTPRIVSSNVPRSCGIDPCYAHKTSTDLVFYTGDSLTCTGIDKCDSVTLGLQKIDTKLCPEAVAQAVFQAISQNPSLLAMLCTMVNSCISPTTTTTSTAL